MQSPVPECEGPGAPLSQWSLRARDRGHRQSIAPPGRKGTGHPAPAMMG